MSNAEMLINAFMTSRLDYCNAMNGLASQYLIKLLLHYSPSCPLQSQNSGHLIIPRISKSTADSSKTLEESIERCSGGRHTLSVKI